MKHISKNRNKFKILGINQRPPAEPGPFEGPSSYHLLCWWSLISEIVKPREALQKNRGVTDDY